MHVMALKVSFTAGEGPDCDLDELVDRIREVLGERSVCARRVHAVERARNVGCRFARPDPRERQPLHDEMSRALQELDHAAGALCDIDQCAVADEL
jgi:hypothetical protein